MQRLRMVYKVFEAEEQMMMLNEELAVTKKSVEVSESNLEVLCLKYF